MPRADLRIAADYICLKAHAAGEAISILKLHKLLYYVQAWSTVFFDQPIFADEFEAWVHGPVCRSFFAKYRDRPMYSSLQQTDWASTDLSSLSEEARNHIDNVLNSYMHLSGGQLEQLSHTEDPWVKARGKLSPYERCSTAISREEMKRFYSAKVAR